MIVKTRYHPSTTNETQPGAPVLAKIPGYVDYLCYSPDTTEAAARAGFVKRYGVEPAECVRDNNLWWLGPIRKDKST
jgi:hypothetical protein